jgi:hypothetical protein
MADRREYMEYQLTAAGSGVNPEERSRTGADETETERSSTWSLDDRLASRTAHYRTTHTLAASLAVDPEAQDSTRARPRSCPRTIQAREHCSWLWNARRSSSSRWKVDGVAVMRVNGWV